MKATIQTFNETSAILAFPNGQTLHIPKKQLPEHAKIGDELVVIFALPDAQGNADFSRAMIQELLRPENE